MRESEQARGDGYGPCEVVGGRGITIRTSTPAVKGGPAGRALIRRMRGELPGTAGDVQ